MYIYNIIYIYIHTYIRRALCPGRVRSQLSTNKEIILLPPPLIPSPRAVLEPRVGELWLRCGFAVAQSWNLNEGRSLLEPSRALLEAARSLKTSQDASKLAPRGLKMALCWLKLASRRPKWSPKASKMPQKCLGKASR